MRISDWSSDVCSSDLEIVDNTFIIRGFSFFGQGQANAMMFTTLKPWGERKGSENSSVTLVGKATGAFMAIKEALVFALNPPAIQELGTAKIGRESCRERVCPTCRSRWSPYHYKKKHI